MWLKVLQTLLVPCLISIFSVYAMYNDDQLYEGSQCILENGANGVCKKLPECPPRIEEVRQGRRRSDSTGRCGFEDFTEIVCCPVNITHKIGLRPAEIACQQLENEITTNKVDSDEITPNIFGGTEAKSGEFPYMAALGYENTDADADTVPIKYICGGTLISSQHVLTAAHCVSNVQGKIPVEVRLGDVDVQSVSATVQRIPINDITTHPRFKRSVNYNDIAILKLKSKAQLSNSVTPICLQTKPLDSMDTTSNVSIVVIGWGSTSFDNDGSPRLMRTPGLSLVNTKECSKYYTDFMKLPYGLNDSMICALGRKDRNASGADACQGDSGGPLLMLSDNGDTVIGVTAFGQSCGGPVPGVYTSVYEYLDWIEEQVWPNDRKD